MTGQRRSPEKLRQKLSQLIRYEMESLPTASVGRLKTLDRESRRADVETVPDGATETNVPIAENFAGDGYGDLRPLDPAERDEPVFGIVIYLHHDLDEQLSSHGQSFGGQREHEEENCIFLPVQFWFDDDTVPEHTGTERRIDHPDGGQLEITETGLEILSDLGAGLEIGDVHDPHADEEGEQSYAEYRAEAWGEENAPLPDKSRWPVDRDAVYDATYSRLRHPDGPGITAVDKGVAIEGKERVSVGRLNDPERQPVGGDYQHNHLMHHEDGTVSMIGPQLTFREFIAWMTDEERQDRLRNAGAFGEAREYALSYLEWLEEESGRELDPTEPGTWPSPEPMPDPETRREWIGQPVPIPVEISPVGATATASTGEAFVSGYVETHGQVLVRTTATSAVTTPPVGITTSQHIHGGAAPTVASTTGTAPTPAVTSQIVQPRTWVDDFAHFDTSQYYANEQASSTADFEVTSDWGAESPQSLQSAYTNDTASVMYSFDPNSDGAWYSQANQQNGLPYYPEPGDTIYVRFRVSVGNDGSWNGASSNPRFLWNANGIANRMHVQIALGLIDAPAELVSAQSSTETTLDSQGATANSTINSGDVLQWEIDWGTDYYVTANLYNVSNSFEQLVSLSGQGPSRSSFSIGFRDRNDRVPPARFDGVWVE